MAGQVDADLAMFPQQAPDEKPKGRTKKAPEPKQRERARAPTNAQLRAAEQLTAKISHDAELQEKIEIIRKVKAFKKKCPERLLDFKIPAAFTVKKSLDELKAVLADCRAELNASNGLRHACQMYELGMGGLQTASARFPQMGLHLEGPNVDLRAAIAGSRAEWMDIMQEITIEYSKWFAVGPVKRLMMFTMQTVLLVSKANTTPNQVRERAQEPASEELAKEADALFA